MVDSCEHWPGFQWYILVEKIEENHVRLPQSTFMQETWFTCLYFVVPLWFMGFTYSIIELFKALLFLECLRFCIFFHVLQLQMKIVRGRWVSSPFVDLIGYVVWRVGFRNTKRSHFKHRGWKRESACVGQMTSSSWWCWPILESWCLQLLRGSLQAAMQKFLHSFRGGVHPGLAASQLQRQTHTLTPSGNLESPVNPTGMFLDWEEAGVPGENSHMHRKNMQTPHKGPPCPNWDSNGWPSCCEAAARTVSPVVKSH